MNSLRPAISLPVRPHSIVGRGMALVLASMVGLALALLLTAAPAGAHVMVLGETSVGLQPREVATVFDGPWKEDNLGDGLFEELLAPETSYPLVETFDNATGAPVLHSVDTYAIYWDPTDHYHGDWQNRIDTFMHDLGEGESNDVFTVDSQYSDLSNTPAASNSTFRGAYTDTNGYPGSGCTDPHPLEPVDQIGPVVEEEHTPICLTDGQVRTQLEEFVVQHGLQRGMNTIFYLLTPPGVTVCLDSGTIKGHCSDFAGTVKGIEKDEAERLKAEALKEAYIKPAELTSYENSFCSYHSDINPDSSLNGDSSTFLYAVIPWTAGGLGDGHLTKQDKTSGYDCQDGGFDPTSEPRAETKEKAKEAKIESEKEKEEHPKTPEEEQIAKEKQEEQEALEGPHAQEPNQETCPPFTRDGSCDAGLPDLIINQIAVEEQNTVTDPLLDAWRDIDGNELTDECRNSFAYTTGGSSGAEPFTFAGTLSNQTIADTNFYLNTAFNLAGQRLAYPGIPCILGVRVEPAFTTPTSINTGEIVGFNGMESTVTLGSAIGYTATGEEKARYASYKWNFGDGTPEVTGFAPGAPSANSPATSPCQAPWEPPCAASTFHVYQYGGTYDVTLTITDVGGHVSSTSQAVTVAGPPPPPPPPPPSTGAGAAGAGQLGTGLGGSSAGPSIPGPVVSASAVSKSLHKVLHRGLIVRYSVNEQVAGRFEVILSSRTAQHLGVHGPAATGLPAGSEPALVIAHAILVTTKGGRSTERIMISKATAARLRKLHKLSLTLRMTVRNAARQNPQTATVTSPVQLSR